MRSYRLDIPSDGAAAVASLQRQTCTSEQAAQRSGGTKHMITEKRSRILVTIKNRLSMSLARQMTQRIFAHVRGSAVHGQYPHPPSALIDLSKVTE